MATISKLVSLAKAPAKSASPVKVADFAIAKGRGKDVAARNAAYVAIAPLSFWDSKGRAELIDAIRAALGAKPDETALLAARTEFVIGRYAARFAGFVADVSQGDRLERARTVVTSYAAPPKDGVRANKLRAGQTGRRSPAEHACVRASEEAWSQVKAELGHGAAKTQAVKDAAKRTRGASPSKDGMSKAPAPTPVTHTELVKADGPMTAADACAYVEQMASTLLMFCNKHAKVMPTNYGTMVKAFKSNVDAAAVVRKAEDIKG